MVRFLKRSLDLRLLRRILASHRRWRRSDAGYNLVLLMVMVTVMNIMLAKATPVWSHLIQREKEEEMIFRGLQYAEAIRVFYHKYNQWPQKLDDLLEDKGQGRSIRRLWNNPLAGPDGAEAEGWHPMFEGQPDPCAVPEPTGLDGQPGGALGQGNRGGEPVVQVGNIVGVCSREAPEIIKREIPNWQFTAQLIDNSVFGNDTGVFPMNAGDIGRGFPGAAELPPQPGVPQNGDQPGTGTSGTGADSGGTVQRPQGEGRPQVPFGTRPVQRPGNRGEG